MPKARCEKVTLRSSFQSAIPCMLSVQRRTEDNRGFLAAALACAIDSAKEKEAKEEEGAVYDVVQTALSSAFRVWRPGVSTSAETLSPTSETLSPTTGTSPPTSDTLSPTGGRGRAATRANARQIMVEKPTHEVTMIAITMKK